MRRIPRTFAGIAIAVAGLSTTGVARAQTSIFTPDASYSIFTPSATPAEQRDVATGPIGVLQRQQQENEPSGFWFEGQHFLPSLTASTLYSNNIFATPSATTGDFVSHLRPALSVNNGQQLISYGLSAYGDFVDYLSHSSLNNVNGGAAVGIIADLAPTFRIESRTNLAYNHLDPTNFVLAVANAAISRLPATTLFEQDLSAIRDVGPWGLGLMGTYIRTESDNVTVGGVPSLLSELNSNVFIVAPKISYAITPDVRGFVTGEYRHESDANGELNAATYSVEAGADFELRRLIHGTVEIGYREHLFDTQGLGSVGGLTYGLSLAWFPTELLTLTARGSQDFTDSILTTGGGAPVVANAKTVSVEADYEVYRRITVSGLATYSSSQFEGISRTDNLLGAGANLNYSISRNWVASTQYRFYERSSTASGFGFEMHQLGVSLKAQF